MNIRAIFDKKFAGEACGAIWIVDSAPNRTWFELNKQKLVPNSALFDQERYTSRQAALCHMIWGIQEHFPTWQEISIVGADLVDLDLDELGDAGRWEECDNGFILHRF